MLLSKKLEFCSFLSLMIKLWEIAAEMGGKYLGRMHRTINCIFLLGVFFDEFLSKKLLDLGAGGRNR